jgi:uncharacterized protein YbjT (DUF2867 family)
MQLVVIGATGRTGRLVVEQALGRGHEVVAYVRRPDALGERPGLRVVGGQLSDQPALAAAMTGADAVLVALGPSGVRDLFGSDLMRTTLPVVAAAMTATGVRRLVLMSAFGVGDTAVPASFSARLSFQTAMRALYRDKQEAESALAATGLDVTTVYPTMLTNGPSDATPVVRDVATVVHVSGMPKVPRVSVATALLDAAEDPSSIGKRLLVTLPDRVR